MLLDHNLKTYERIKKAFENNTSICLIHGTGLGKSFIFFELCNEIFKKTNVLYVIPKWSIAENLEQYPEFANINTEVYFLTYNAFREELDLSDYDYIIFDECHHLGSLIFGANALKSCKGIKTIGLTATNKREDNIDVTEYFDTAVEGMSVFDAIHTGLIPQIEYIVCRDDDIKITTNKKYRLKVDYKKSLPLLNEVLHKNLEGRNRWICFFNTIAELTRNIEVVRDLFPEEYKLIIITTEHNGTIAETLQYEKTVIMSVSKLLEGAHISNTTGILVFRNVTSTIVFQQMIGRIVHVGNTQVPLILDCTEAAIRILAKLLKEDKNFESNNQNNLSGTRRPILYHSLNNIAYFDIGKLLALKQWFWDEEEIQFLKDNFNKITLKELSDELGRPEGGIREKAISLHLMERKDLDRADWSKEEINLFKDNYSDMTLDELEKLFPNKTRRQITIKASVLHLHKNRHIQEEDEIIKKYYGKISNTELLDKLQSYKTISSIKSRAAKLGITKKAKPEWTEEEDRILRDCYKGKMTLDEALELLPIRTKDSATRRAHKLGITKTTYTRWTKEQDQIILDNLDKYTCGKMAEMIPGKDKESIRSRIKRLKEKGLISKDIDLRHIRREDV